MTRANSQPTQPWRRLGAFLAAGLVLALAVLAASPGLHAQVHRVAGAGCAGHEAPGEAPLAAETCAVELFVGGLGLPVLPPQAVPAPLAAGVEVAAGPVEAWYVAAPHRQPPGRGPPRA